MAGPLVRSSYRAGRLYAQATAHRGEEVPDALRHLAEAGPASQEISSVLSRHA
jgi:lipoic acid synthetase